METSKNRTNKYNPNALLLFFGSIRSLIGDAMIEKRKKKRKREEKTTERKRKEKKERKR